MLTKEGKIRIPSGCAISGIMNKKGKRFSGEDIIKSISLMHERSNGLGGGFAAYGIYPEYKELFAFHIFYDNTSIKEETEIYLSKLFDIENSGRIPTKKVPNISEGPIIWRYFVRPNPIKLLENEHTEDEFVAQCVFNVNSTFEGAYIFSSGKNMGAFKGVGYPEDIGEFYMLESYDAYLWTAHGRFPTNTPGWWGGAHPFTLLDWSIVHNGEISSYDANRRFVEMFGYKCTLLTDTEVITYLFDLLIRKHKMSLENACKVVAAPLWQSLPFMDKEEAELIKSLRTVYSSALINGPFSIILGFTNGMMALNDRLKLRSLIAAEKNEMLYLASEESAIRVICSNPTKVWSVEGGKPVIAYVEGV